MKCGCVSSGVLRARGRVKFDPPIPICVVHECDEIATEKPDLTGRLARCGCGKTMPSDYEALAFFEYRGPGSRFGRRVCKTCRYADVAHEKKKAEKPGHLKLVCDKFAPIGEHQFDAYYCGHAGWD